MPIHIYNSSDSFVESKAPLTNFTFCGDDLTKINQFCKSANLSFLFDFNVMLRRSDGSWNEDNARRILDFSSAQVTPPEPDPVKTFSA